MWFECLIKETSIGAEMPEWQVLFFLVQICLIGHAFPAEFLDLRLEDVGRCLELVYTPARKDGVKGSATCVLFTAVSLCK
ncbi:hypothetical protein RHMOL_Rhmol03G0146900 [Rhododendron molle]|uniref:Uncharacterized protein n=1 Tax=Rhododendron molle TaxID=49168 RepID=A0ACC0PGT7_RHOML|nr:hypothetical protein RHMOL_Rhmol03G0146900 [Rhododendron molle]